MTFNPDTLRQQIPYYLTADPNQKAILANLKALMEGANSGYFIRKEYDGYTSEMLQGDGWRGLQIFSFPSNNKRAVRGIVLSNSCDISPENQRVVPQKVTFAPIVKLSKIKDRFVEYGLDEKSVSSRLQAIRSQDVTNIFYLPEDGLLDGEHVALLDDLHSMPTEGLLGAAEKLFTLSMAAFYLFVFKLSVHFCRLHENVDRRPSATFS
jgi:hypothetical protein